MADLEGTSVDCFRFHLDHQADCHITHPYWCSRACSCCCSPISQAGKLLSMLFLIMVFSLFVVEGMSFLSEGPGWEVDVCPSLDLMQNIDSPLKLNTFYVP